MWGSVTAPEPADSVTEADVVVESPQLTVAVWVSLTPASPNVSPTDTVAPVATSESDASAGVTVGARLAMVIVGVSTAGGFTLSFTVNVAMTAASSVQVNVG